MADHPIVHKLTRYYRAHQPELIDPQVSLAWVNTSGWESEIYAYTLTAGEPNQRHAEQRVLRLLTGGQMADAEREFHYLTLLNKAGYPVPQVYTLGHENDGLGYPFIIMACIQGGSFGERFVPSLTGDPGPLSQFVDLFRRLHTLDWRPYVENPADYEQAGDPFYYFDRILAEFDGHLTQAGLVDFEPVMGWLKAQRERVPCAHGSIIHLDFHHNNILEDADGRLVVIDWTSAQISDDRFDLAWTLTLALAYRGPAGRAAILEAYQEEPVPSLDVFEVAAILRRIGTVMISLRAGADALGMRPEAVQAMRRDAQPLAQIYGHLCHLTGLDLPGIRGFISELI
ncbi:MAG: phosphotransferase [Brevefilum sp.]|nr:phosphotransferase [Brevefilum sp.]